MNVLPVVNQGLIQSLVDQAVQIASSVAGGDLSTLHTRAGSEMLEQQISSAVSPTCATLLDRLSAPGAYIQGSPNVRIHRPFDPDSCIPFHSDVLYGHSLDEINYWINLTPAFGTNSLWMTSVDETEALHHALKYDRLTLEALEARARSTARPIVASSPGVHTFCCAQLHGAVLNETGCTRVSIDLRVLKPGGRPNVKGRGGYFRPKWLPHGECPLTPGTPATTVASLDEATPVYLQRVAIQKFYPQQRHRELVEFHGLPYHSPTLTDAMAQGPVIAYTVRQLREVPKVVSPIGFADERIWITPDTAHLLERFMKENSSNKALVETGSEPERQCCGLPGNQ